LAANAVVRGDIPPESIVAGVPGRVIKNRRDVYLARAEQRAAVADIQRKTAEAAKANMAQSSGGHEANSSA
jgi:serine acetyltransferase